MLIILDCGTTNIKCYLTQEDTIIFSTSKQCNSRKGRRDGGRYAYQQVLRDVVTAALAEAHKSSQPVDAIIAFGMISSDVGLMVVPHLTTPVSLAQLKEGIFRVEDTTFLGVELPFFIIRGVKNALEYERHIENIFVCDFMRGEETQIMGLLKTYEIGCRCNVITLSSHCKITHVDESGAIAQSLTTMSGQIFDCIMNNTIVGKSIDTIDDKEMTSTVDEMICLARRADEEFGLMRTLLLPRFMENFTTLSPMDRRVFLEAVISIEDTKALRQYRGTGIWAAPKTFIIGQSFRSKIFSRIYAHVAPETEIVVLDDAQIKEISVAGAKLIFNNNTIIGGLE